MRALGRRGGLITGAVTLVAVAALGGGSAAAVARQAAPASPEARVETYLDQIRSDPGRLREFLHDLPKGADIHTHLTGAAPTRQLLAFAERDGLCINTTTVTATSPPCTTGQRPAADAKTDLLFRDQILRSWSMQAFTPGKETGHDHFFATFAKWGPASSHTGELLAGFASEAADQHESALEVFSSTQSGAARALGTQAGYDPDFAAMRAKLLANGAMDKLVTAARGDTDSAMTTMRSTLRCGQGDADPACTLPVRFDFQAQRTYAPEAVFAMMVLAFELAEQDSRWVAVNLVAPEDDPVALRDYRLHMSMLGFLRKQYRKAHITLHAGELAPGLVPPAELKYHIRSAVETAGAERIGHGVDIASETDSAGLLREMARKNVLVEINLTSNCQILVVCGKKHPFALYRKAGVPVTLSTDDEGVEHTDLTSEYVRAVTTFHLHYRDLKTIARASLAYSFLQPDAKAAAQKAQQADFTAFEDLFGNA